jgi:hypothetical protein
MIDENLNDENLNDDDINIIENSKTVDSNVELNNDRSDSESVEKINVEIIFDKEIK